MSVSDFLDLTTVTGFTELGSGATPYTKWDGLELFIVSPGGLNIITPQGLLINGQPLSADIAFPATAFTDMSFQPNNVTNSALVLHNNVGANAGLEITGTNGAGVALTTVGTAGPIVVSGFVDYGGQVYNPKAYGALGDGSTIDTTALQATIAAANAAYVASGSMQVILLPHGTFMVDAVNYVPDGGGVNGVTSLKMLDGVRFTGFGTIKVKANAYGGGAFYRVFSSRDVTQLSNASIEDITIDGNSANQTGSTQCNNILLYCATNVRIKGVNCINANGEGIQLVSASLLTYATNLEVSGCTVNGATGIGIQVSQFDGLRIVRNFVTGTTDNGIDVYGEDTTVTPHGRNFVISGNVVKASSSFGIFCDTVANGTVSGNTVQGCTLGGAAVNRINGAPKAITIVGNTFITCPTGLRLTGDMTSISVTGNTISDFSTAGIQLGGGGGNISQVSITGNFFDPTTSTTYLIVTSGGGQASDIKSWNNTSTSTNHAYDLNDAITTKVNTYYEPPVQTSDPTSAVQPALDSLVVHLAGTETITGAKTFSVGLVTGVGQSVSAGNFTDQANTGNYWQMSGAAATTYLLGRGGGTVDIQPSTHFEHLLTTANNTLDDGSGNATFSGGVTAGVGQSISATNFTDQANTGNYWQMAPAASTTTLIARGAGGLAIQPQTSFSAAVNITSASATALTVAASGANYGLKVDESTASAVTGLLIKAGAAGGGLALSVINGNAAESLTIDAKGAGGITIGGTSTGDVTIGGTGVLNFGYASQVVSGASPAVIGSITGGPATNAQYGWRKVKSTTTTEWIPVWR